MSQLEDAIRATLADPPGTPAAGPELVDAAIGRVRSRRRIRRAGSVTGLALAVVVVALVVAGLAGSPGKRPATTSLNVGPPSTATVAPKAVASATVDQLRGGHWAELPDAPIPSRTSASVVWTGRELLVWGGQASNNQLRADGAAYDPATDRWRTLPASPLSPRMGQAAVWTGTELVVWGGYDQASGNSLHVTGDGAAYNPATDRWRMLARSPLSPRTFTEAVWTGSQVIFLGGQPAVLTDTIRGYGDGALYDPTRDRWQLLAPPTPPGRHPLVWRTVVQAGDRLVAFSEWAISKSAGPNSTEESGGLDLFSLDEHTARWQLVPAGSAMLPDVDEVLWTGQRIIQRGITYNCGVCPGPFVPEATALYDPATGIWTRLPADPLGGDHLLSTWTGAALVSLNGGGIYGTVQPGNTSAYDPVHNTWSMLPSAPSGCDTDQPPIWTGTQLLLYCPQSSIGPGPGRAGLAFTADSSAPTTPAPNGLQVHWTLSSTKIAAGSSVSGDVTVDNPGSPLQVSGCGQIFGAVLRSPAIPQDAVTAGCLQYFTIPSGRSVYPIKVDAIYTDCSQASPPLCLPTDRIPPLPPGHYQAVIFYSGGLPIPTPIDVTITPATP
jgi:hypothetical protein